MPKQMWKHSGVSAWQHRAEEYFQKESRKATATAKNISPFDSSTFDKKGEHLRERQLWRHALVTWRLVLPVSLLLSQLFFKIFSWPCVPKSNISSSPSPKKKGISKRYPANDTYWQTTRIPMQILFSSYINWLEHLRVIILSNGYDRRPHHW